MVIPYQLDSLHGSEGGSRRWGKGLGGRDAAAGGGSSAGVLRAVDGSRAGSPVGVWVSSTATSGSTPATCQTTLPGVFAVGDVATYAGKLKLILQGSARARWRRMRSTRSCIRIPRCTSSIRPARAFLDGGDRGRGSHQAIRRRSWRSTGSGSRSRRVRRSGCSAATARKDDHDRDAAGVVDPSAGSIRILGHDMATDRYAALARMNFSSPYIALPSRVERGGEFAGVGHLYGVRGLERRIAETGGDARSGRVPGAAGRRVVGGAEDAVTLAKALINRPDVLLLDEPTASLDPDTGDTVRSALEGLSGGDRLHGGCWRRTTWPRWSGCATTCSCSSRGGW